MLQSLCGLIVIPLIAWLLCERRAAVPIGQAGKIAAGGIALQFIIAGLFILIPQLSFVFDLLAGAVIALQTATGTGMKFLFGYLAGGPTPFTVTDPGKGFVLALQALPIIVMMSVIARLLYHLGILQKVVGFLAWLLGRSMGVTGPVGTVAAANVFVGMVEAPILARPYLEGASRGALFAMMTTGMATVAGTVMALYAIFLEPVLAGAAGHILLASLMSAPAALVTARLMVPWSSEEDAIDVTEIGEPYKSDSVMEAIATGTTDGVRLVVSVAAMLVVMVALVALVDMALSAATSPFGATVSAQQIFGWVMTPLALLTGIPWSEAAQAGQLIGVKTVLNELLAYLQLADTGTTVLSDRSRLILTYALCGFANFGSLGIMTGGLLALCPDRRVDILSLGPRSLVSGLLATLMTGAVIGVMTPP
ncbi:nucleoside transporter C-terminal domain-containing protein [Anderseniella sp. Alg231-50]|uniref:nucleoside transporter C-terminal domain-containing protein n=1 Tax=Anderseniella sp. Alg231-50 TaxID=1922226 RepID=UPI000D552724